MRILLGITGSIAAYKSIELARRLKERGMEVRVVMTAAAREFVGPLSLQAVSGQPVHTDLLDPEAESAMGHIQLARWCDRVLVAPASANFLARLTHGLADDLLTTLCLVSESPISVAPAMNRQMWEAPATQQNCQVLRQRGVEFLGPASGHQACGEVGPGRMLEPDQLIASLPGIGMSNLLAGTQVLVTAGPTREAIDPVRYISNRSSGKMGYAVARAAARMGAKVILVSGPVNLTPPYGVECIAVTSAAEMLQVVMKTIQATDIFIAAAAVADYACREPAATKIKKSQTKKNDGILELRLDPTPDILANVSSHQGPRPFVVGFAAETNDVEANARVKLIAKSLDMIAANQVGQPGIGFDSDDNALTVFWPQEEKKLGRKDLTKKSKIELARELMQLIAERYNERY